MDIKKTDRYRGIDSMSLYDENGSIKWFDFILNSTLKFFLGGAILIWSLNLLFGLGIDYNIWTLIAINTVRAQFDTYSGYRLRMGLDRDELIKSG